MLPLQACEARYGFILVFIFQAALFKDQSPGGRWDGCAASTQCPVL